jgi:hypothetical protein
MDLGTTLIGAIISIICLLPFVLMAVSRRKREKQLLQTLVDYANEYEGNITQHETVGDIIIGLDEKSNTVFFYTKNKIAETKQYIRLADYKKCNVVSTTRDFNNSKVIDTVELSFIPIEKTTPIEELSLFNTKYNLQLSGELQLAEKWAKLVNSKIVN